MAKVVIDLTSIGLTLSSLTLSASGAWCKTTATNTDVSTGGSTLTERGNGIYILDNPNVIEDSDFRVYVTSDNTKYAVGIFSPADGDLARRSEVAKPSDILIDPDTDKIDGSLLDRAISTTLPTSGYTVPDNTTITNIYNEVITHPTLTEMLSGGIALESTLLTRSASGEYTSSISSIKSQTDKFIFNVDNFVKSDPQTTVTATISISDMDTIVNKVWDETRTQHTSGGTMVAGIPAASMGRV